MRLPLALRFAFRELRGGLRGFGIFLACIVLGVAAIAGVGSVARGMTEGLAREGRAILGGDIAVTLLQRTATPAETAWLAARGTVSEVAAMRAIARRADGDGQALVELKAVDRRYPLVGAVEIAGGGDLAASLAPVDGLPGALAEAELTTRAGIGVGDRFRLGTGSFILRGIIVREPDRLADGFSFGPRLMIAADALPSTGLVQPGSLVEWRYRLILPDAPSDAAVDALGETAAEAFPDGAWRVRTRGDAAPGLRANIERFAQFLTLIGLAALVVGGVGVANAVSAYLDRKRGVIATLKCLGAPAGFPVAVYLAEILIIAGLGIAAGLAVGAAVPYVAGSLLAAVVPVTIGGLHPPELALAAVYGILTALAFALHPLGRARAVSAAALFRDHVAPAAERPPRRYRAAVAAALALLAGLAVGLSHEPRIAAIFVAATAASFLLLRAVAGGLMALARRAPATGSTELRLALGNIHRPGALTPAVVLSLGLGLTLLVALVLIDGNFRRALFDTIPGTAPSFFMLDIQGEEAAGLRDFVAARAPGAALEMQPMLRGRITALNGVPADRAEVDPEARWVLRGDRGITYAATPPADGALTAGAWWPEDYDGPPLVSFGAEAAAGLRLGLGDTVTVNVLGREVTAEIASLREIDWQSLSINSVMVFTPNAFRGAPFQSLATLAFPDGGTPEEELAFLKAVVAAFPAVTVIRVKDAIATANDLVAQIGWAVRGASAVTLLAAMLVLAGAFAAGRRQRTEDAVILKTLGATRPRLAAAFALEFLMLGGATAALGLAAGSLAAWLVLATVMDVPFAFLPGPAFGAALAALGLTLVFGLAGTWRVLGRKAAPFLRNL